METKTIYILPGWGGSKKTWNEFVFLAKEEGLNAKIIELPCFGNEPCPTNVWGIEEYARFVADKLEGKKDVVLYGHSFGGQVATYLAANNLANLRMVFLSGAPIIRKPNTSKKRLIRAISKVGKRGAKILGLTNIVGILKPLIYQLIGSPDYQKTTGMMREIFQKITTQNLLSIVKNITVPVHVVWGSNDSYVPVKEAYLIKNELQRGTIKIFEAGGHGIHVKKPKDLIHYILKLV